GSRTADQVARLAAEATGAVCALLWEREPERPLRLAASFRLGEVDASLVNAGEAAEQALLGRDAVAVEEVEGLPGGASVTATLQLGQPPVGALQLLFEDARFPTEPDLAVLATFGVRASHALRAGHRSRAVALELERTRALLAVVGQAISELSLAHTLETAVARVAELLDEDRLAVYLLGEDGLDAAGSIGLAGPHVQVAERLLELALGPFRSRGILVVHDVPSDPRATGVADAAAEAGIETAVAVPLLARNDVIGLLGVFPQRGRV